MKKIDELKTEMSLSIKNGEVEKFINLQNELSEIVAGNILESYKAENLELNEVNNIDLSLTAEERAYYNEVLEIGFDKVDKLMPPTIFERVFEDLRQTRPLLKEIDFINSTGLTTFVYRDETKDGQSAFWNTLNSAITKKLETSFKTVKVGANSLTAYIPIHHDMLTLGPKWLDRYIVELLKESIAIGLETAIVTGDGNNKPVGMIKDLGGAVTGGVYPDKTAVELKDFSVKTLSETIMSPLTKEGKRTVDNVLVVVNPADYWSKVYPLTSFLTADKVYVHGVMPIPCKIVQSSAVPVGKMVAGLARDYFVTVSSDRKIKQSDECKFLEDLRLYKTKMLADGRPKDNDSFILFDISKLGEEEETKKD